VGSVTRRIKVQVRGPVLKVPKAKRARDMAQVVELLSRRHKAPRSKPQYDQKKNYYYFIM
jgi:hypothetical protein